MSAQVSLGRLFVRFGVETSDLTKGKAKATKELRDMERRVQQTQRRITGVLGRIAPWLTITGAILGVSRALSQMAQEARALEDLRTQTGLSVKSLGELRGVVEQTGGSMSDLTTAVTSFNAAVRIAARDSQSEAAQAFRALGISVTDARGNLITFDQVAGQIARRFEAWPNGVNKAAIANTVFGGAATAMTRALNEGERVIDEAKRGADRYGVSVETAHKASLLWDERTRNLARAMRELRDAAASLAAGPLGFVLKLITDGVRGMMGSQEWHYAQGVKVIEGQIQKQEELLKGYEAEAERLQTIARLARESGKTEVWREQIAALRELGETTRKADEELSRLHASLGRGSQSPWQADVKPVEPPAPRQIGMTPDQMRAFQEQMRMLKAEMDALNESPAQFSKLFSINQDDFDSTITRIDALMAKYKDQADLIHRLQGMKEQLYRREQDLMLSTANMASSTITAVFAKSKKAAIAAAAINTAVGVTRALRDVPWPYNWVQAAMVAAQGAAQMAQIRSTSEGGGSVKSVSGAAQAAEPAAPSRALHVQGVDPGAFYSGPVVEGLIRNINDAVQNGTTLISTKQVSI